MISTPDCEWETSQNKEWQWNEGPFVLKHDGKYYLTYSANYYASLKYAVGFAVAERADGPYRKSEKNPILAYVENEMSGPGHNSFFTAKDGKLKCAFHIHADYNEPKGSRVVCIADAGFDQDGNLFIDYK